MVGRERSLIGEPAALTLAQKKRKASKTDESMSFGYGQAGYAASIGAVPDSFDELLA